MGTFLEPMVRVAPSGHHVAYEPVPSFAALLRDRFPTVKVREQALSDKAGERTMLHVLDQGYEGYSSLSGDFFPRDREFLTEPLTVHVDRLDDRLPDGWLPDFVKIDVEGEELPVLKELCDAFHGQTSYRGRAWIEWRWEQIQGPLQAAFQRHRSPSLQHGRRRPIDFGRLLEWTQYPLQLGSPHLTPGDSHRNLRG